MARLQLPTPTTILFETRLAVRIGDINYGAHLANDAVLSLAHEARMQFLKSCGYSEMDVEGLGIIMTDAAVCYKSQAFYGDTLRFAIGLTDFNRYGCDILYQVNDDNTGLEVARLKTGIVFFDYPNQKIARMPVPFARRFGIDTGDMS
jgi:acyl-CoA thioester hydrolase